METNVLRINCRIEELPVLGRFLLSSMQEGLADFTNFSPDYDAAFMTEANDELAIVESLVHPRHYTAELKVITEQMYQSMRLLRDRIYLLEGYIKRAEGLTIGQKDFGISEVRLKNNRGDVEGLIAALVYLEANVTNNMAALTAKGYTPVLHDQFTEIINKLRDDNTAQNDKINERNNRVVANYEVLNGFWDRLADISDAGKRIYRVLAPNKMDDFTMQKLKNRMRQEQKNTRISGRVMSHGLPLKDAKVALRPLAAGRIRSGKSKADGEYEIKSLEPGDY